MSHQNIPILAPRDEESKKAINKMINGTKVYINNVRILGPDGSSNFVEEDIDQLLNFR